ncbi:MAG: BrnT family toxin [Coriobacteriia bacterium]|nr:BrnT family toxin [Coriobacteriia bacterium]
MILYGFITFEWDDAKAASNLEKHGVSFEEAATVFYDPHALVVDDDEHSIDEDRFIIVGLSSAARTLTVCHCYRETNEVIRIISARKATKNEERGYWRRRNEG